MALVFLMSVVLPFVSIVIFLFLLLFIHFLLGPSRKLVVPKFERCLFFVIVLLHLLIFILPDFVSQLILLLGSIFDLMVFKMLIELLFLLWVVDQANCCSCFVGDVHYLIRNLEIKLYNLFSL